MSVTENKANIAVNRRRVFELENQVLHNRALAHASRSLVSENTALVMKNYQAAFVGNRQLAVQNTDDAFRNRLAIVRALPDSTDVLKNYKEAMTNKVKLEFLEHRSKMNERVLATTAKISEANKALINANRDIMDTNEEIAQFNAKIIEANTRLLSEPLDASKVTPASNAELIAANAAKIEEIAKRSAANKEKIKERMDEASRNRTSAVANSQSIMERRERILENHAKIAANQRKVAQFVAKL